MGAVVEAKVAVRYHELGEVLGLDTAQTCSGGGGRSEELVQKVSGTLRADPLHGYSVDFLQQKFQN